MRLRLAAPILLLSLLSVVAWGSDGGRTAADFLNIGIDARSAALGGSGAALGGSVAAAYWNPGGLASINSRQLLISHFALYQDISFNYVGVAVPFRERMALSAGFAYLGYGTIDGYDASNNATGDINGTYDAAAHLSLGYSLSDSWSGGLTVKYIIISLDGEKATAAAIDLGACYSNPKVTAALTLANFGTNIRFNKGGETLPSVVRVGVAVRPFGEAFQMLYELDNPLHSDPSFKSGWEYGFDRKYFLRAGYRYAWQSDRIGAVSGLSFGAGAVFGPTQLDYSYSPGGNIVTDNLHRFSFLMTF